MDECSSLRNDGSTADEVKATDVNQTGEDGWLYEEILKVPMGADVEFDPSGLREHVSKQTSTIGTP